MNPILAPVVFTVMGVGLIVGGVLMLIRPELFRGIPPEEEATPGATRMGAGDDFLRHLCTATSLCIRAYVLRPR
jgi:hypothetical protein